MKNKNGFFLFEAMVAILIFIVGVIALLDLQNKSVENTTDAQFRGSAYMLANNLINLISVDYGNIANYTNEDTINSTTECDVKSGSCTEFERWKVSLIQSIPNSKVNLNYDATSKIINITIKWPNKLTNGETSFSLNSQLR